MKAIALAAILTLTVQLPAVGDESPFATPGPTQLSPSDVSKLVSLGDIMADTQQRHLKLWYAGRSEDWDLARYELDRISESLSRAAMLYMNIPVEYVQAAGQPLSRMREAFAAKNGSQFTQSFADLTAACNACHQAGQVGFIRIQTPTANPFSNEVFGR